MSDVIKGAKQLLDGATPGEWEHYDDHGIVSLTSGGMAIATDLNAWDADLIAASPELAQALAEENWEYQVEEKWLTNSGAEWRPVEKVWHSSIRDARLSSPAESQTRIVRRRVSPPEVIND